MRCLRSRFLEQLNLGVFLLNREVGPVQFTTGRAQRRFQHLDVHLRIGSGHKGKLYFKRVSNNTREFSYALLRYQLR